MAGDTKSRDRRPLGHRESTRALRLSLDEEHIKQNRKICKKEDDVQPVSTVDQFYELPGEIYGS
jgi:hypothetical protein